QANGLCIIDKHLLSLLPAQAGGQPIPPKSNSSNPPPPGTPRHPRRAEDHLKRGSGQLPPPLHHPHVRRPLIFDIEDEEKENEPPQDQKEEDYHGGPLTDWLARLLQKWEEDIDSLQRKVLEDFKDFKLKLGIHTSFS
ncbi:^E4, partial [Gammapapillomavirus 8]